MATALGTEVGAPAALVDAAPATPPLISLLTSGRVDETGVGDWTNGVAFLPETCGAPANPYWWACPEGAANPPAFTKAAPTISAVSRFRSFDIWDAVGASAMSWRGEDWQARARRALLVHQSAHIERELWTGTIATLGGFPNDFLEKAPTIVGGAALGYTRALAELEQAAADVTDGRPAMIHALPRLVSLWSANGLVTPSASGRMLRTALGTIVVPGAGYTGSGPTIAVGAPTVASSYAYITGIVNVRLGPIRELRIEGNGTTADAAFVPNTNDFVVRVERPVVYWFDPCLKHGQLVSHTAAL